MTYIGHTEPKMLIADAGKKLKDKNDVYIEGYTDEYGNEIPAQKPYLSSFIFLGSQITTEEQARELYEEVEE